MSVITDDIMKKLLIALGFSEKEAEVYLALLEIGSSSAAVIAKRTNQAKSTVLFFLDKMIQKGYVIRSQRGRVQYFHADPKLLQQQKQKELETTQSKLSDLLPLLEEIKNPYSTPPKIVFREGVENCKKAYLEILESDTEVLEFGSYGDLESKFGQKFMSEFIQGRIKNDVEVKVIGKVEGSAKKVKSRDKKEKRTVRFFPEHCGPIHSAVNIFNNKVLLLNVSSDAYAITIENQEFYETLKSLHELIWKQQA